MPRKSCVKKVTPVKAETSAVKAEKPKIAVSEIKKGTPVKTETSAINGEKQKRAVSEIDEIFAEGKKRKSERENEANGVGKMKNKKRKKGHDKGKIRVEKETGFSDKGKTRVEKGGGLADQPFHQRKKTGDGLKLYTEDELGIANPDSGGTRLCPFDCDCCF